MKQFEQHEYIFDLDSEEFPQLEGLNPLQTGQLLQSLLVINGLLAQRAEGYIDKNEYDERKVRIMSLLSEPVKDKLTEVLKVD
jgi:hypothetical protein